MRKPTVDNIKIHNLSRVMVVIIIVFLIPGVLLYWQNALTLGGLTVWILELVIIGLFFVFAVRVAQKNGFIDGFKNGLDGVERMREKS